MSAYLGPVVAGQVRQPLLRVKAGGIVIPRPIEASVTTTNTKTASKWAVHVALVDTDLMNGAWFASQADIRIEIDVSVDGGNSFTTLVSGVTDEIDLSPNENEVVISGRDLTALLIDNKTALTYQNQTSSEIVTLLAKAAGLTPVVTATKTTVGTYYASNHVRMSLGDLAKSVTDWDLLNYLAQQEGFDVFVKANSLYFQPAASSNAQPYSVWFSRAGGIASSNVISLQMRRSLTLAKNITVTVNSWNSAQKKMVTSTASAKPNAAGATGSPQKYVFTQPNLTPSQAADYVNLKLAQISRHELTISFDAPGDTILDPRGVISLTGTGTNFDQLYYPDSITRNIGVSGGFHMSVTARNHSSVNQVALATGGGTQISGLGF